MKKNSQLFIENNAFIISTWTLEIQKYRLVN